MSTLTEQNGIKGIQTGNQFTNLAYANPTDVAGATQGAIQPFVPPPALAAANTTSPIKATTPVITAQAAKDDYAAKLQTFNDLQGQVAQQKTAVAQAAAQRAADEAQKAVQDSEYKLKQQGLNIDKQQADTAATTAQAKAAAVKGITQPSSTTQGTSDTTTGQQPVNGTQLDQPQGNEGVQNAQDYATAQKSLDAQFDPMIKQSLEQLHQISQGVFPLNPAQSALLSATQASFQQLIQIQTTANQAEQGAVQEASFRQGGEYTPTQAAGQLAYTISQGVQRISSIDTTMAKTMATLQEGFDKENYEMVNNYYGKLTDLHDAKTKELKDMADSMSTAIKDHRDFEYKKGQDEIKNTLESAKFTYQQKQDAIENAYKRGVLSETQRHNMAMEAIQKEPTAKEKKDTADALKNAQASVPIMQDKIAAVDSLLSHPGLDSRVGPNILSRKMGLGGIAAGAGTGAVVGGAGGAFFGGVGAIPGAAIGAVVGAGAAASQGALDSFTGAGQDFSGSVHKLVNGLTLDSLIEAKARGATFGALSEGELSLLASSASQLNDWEIKDKKGNGTGVWNIDEASFKRELTNIQNLTKRALYLSNQSLLDDKETSELDQVFDPKNRPLDPSIYY